MSVCVCVHTQDFQTYIWVTMFFFFFASKCIQKKAGGAHPYLDVGGQGDFKSLSISIKGFKLLPAGGIIKSELTC